MKYLITNLQNKIIIKHWAVIRVVRYVSHMFAMVSDGQSYFELQTEQIICEYKNKALVLHPDKQTSEESDELFKQLVKAKDVLSNSETRRSYDKWRNSGIAMSFDKWQRMGKDVQISMHWINSKTTKELPIGYGDNATHPIPDNRDEPIMLKTVHTFRDEQYDNDLIRKFRNYQV